MKANRFRVGAVLATAALVAVAACGGPETAAPAVTPEPTVTPSPAVTPGPTPSPTASPDPTPIPQLPAAIRALQVERRLAQLGFPTGMVDGQVTERTRQALCAWRDVQGLDGGRAGLGTTVADSVLAATAPPVADRPDGLYVNKTCQVLFQVVDQKYRRIVWISSAASGYRTPSGTGRVWRKWAGAHESSLYPDAWMYDALYFRQDHPGIALHGSATNALVHSYPASHGCVRVWRPDIHEIFAETPVGTLVEVYGEY